ncbi:MAG: hypothetical protein O4859_06350 [Trichodesmium sp. St18_bin1]|nr:hypothetical protein [Trichodesmium sp. St18_bin1]MDE5123296.1 hypothetical protein [Trichodesmium sp. St19_bin1]
MPNSFLISRLRRSIGVITSSLPQNLERDISMLVPAVFEVLKKMYLYL